MGGWNTSPGSGFNAVVAARVGMAATAAMALFFGLRGFSSAQHDVVLSTSQISAAEKRLIVELNALRACWDPRDRQKLLDGAPANVTPFEEPLGEILKTTEHPLLVPAAEYAGAMGARSLRGLLVFLVESKKPIGDVTRALAVRSAEQLQPWAMERLGQLLESGSTPVRAAVIELCRDRPKAPWSEILEMLIDTREDADAEVLRDAAIRAFPSQPSKLLIRELLTMITTGDEDLALLGLRALSNTQPDAALIQRIADELDRFERGAVSAGLSLLGSWGKPLGNAKPVWSLLQRDDLGIPTQAMAMFCLEQTKSYDVARVREALPSLAPPVRYFAARCLLAAGQRDGTTVLLDLIEDEDEVASVPSRQLLAWLTGRSPVTGRDGFQEALPRALSSLGKRRLPAPGFDFAVPSQSTGAR